MSTEIATLPANALRTVEDHCIALFDTARFEQMCRIAEVMASSTLIPDHLWQDKKGSFSFEQVRGNCFLIVNQAMRWGLDPFSVAPETYFSRGKMSYQGKLVAAVINTRAGIKGRLKYSYSGEGDDLTVTVSATFVGDDQPSTVTVSLKDAKTSNEIWLKDPKQKLAYNGAIKWARLHAPEVILGVHTDDDLERMEANKEMKQAEGHEVNYDDPHQRAIDLWRRDCKITEEYNAKLKEQGVPEEQWEEMPEMPESLEDSEPAQKEKPSVEPSKETPWREVIVTGLRGVSGKKLGNLGLETLTKMKESLQGMSQAVLATKPALAALVGPVTEAVAELGAKDAPVKATPLEGLKNLMATSGISERAVLDYFMKEKGQSPGKIEHLSEKMAEYLIAEWPDRVEALKAASVQSETLFPKN